MLLLSSKDVRSCCIILGVDGNFIVSLCLSTLQSSRERVCVYGRVAKRSRLTFKFRRYYTGISSKTVPGQELFDKRTYCLAPFYEWTL